MTSRLLFDQNLSPRLVGRVAGRFPASAHVGEMGLSTATDVEVLEFAERQDFVIVTKDKDFADLVTSRGDGPRVLWVMLGNVTTVEDHRRNPRLGGLDHRVAGRSRRRDRSAHGSAQSMSSVVP